MAKKEKKIDEKTILDEINEAREYYPKINERGAARRINTPETRSAAHGDLEAARNVLDELIPDWREKRDEKGNIKKLDEIIKKLEEWGQTRQNDKEFAILVMRGLNRSNSSLEEAYEGLKLIRRIIVQGSRTIKNKKMEQFPPPPKTPRPPKSGSGGSAIANAIATATAQANVNINIENKIGSGGEPKPPEPPREEKRPGIVISAAKIHGGGIRANIALDGTVKTTTYRTEVDPHSSHIAVAPREVDNRYEFVRWDTDESELEIEIWVSERDVRRTALYKGKKVTPPPPPPEESEEKKKCHVTIDSLPMQDVFVEVRRRAKLTNEILIEKLETYLPDYYHSMILEFVKAIRQYEDKNIKDKEEQIKFLEGQLSVVIGGFGTPHMMTLNLRSMTVYIIDEILGDWQKLDSWLKEARGRDPANYLLDPPFKIYRNQRYYPTKAEEYGYTIRNQMANQTAGRDFVGPYIYGGGLADPIKRSCYTVFYLELPEGDYKFKADPDSEISVPFDHWEIEGVSADRIYDIKQYHKDNAPPGINERLVRSVQKGIITHYDKELEIHIDKKITLTAVYKKPFDDKYKESIKAREEKAKQEGSYRYQRGATAGGGDLRKGSILGRVGIRSRLGRSVEPRKDLGKDPYLLAAANKGKRILNGYAKAEYSRLFDPLNKRFGERMKELKQLKKDAKTARSEAKKLVRQNKKAAGLGVFSSMSSKSNEDLLNLLGNLIKSRSGDPEETEAFKNARDALEIYMKTRDKYFDDFRVETESKTAQMKEFMRAKAVTVATGLAQRYRMPAGSGSETALTNDLLAYADIITEDFIVRGRTWRHALMRGMGVASRGTETFSATGVNALQSTVDFILGPWTWTTIFALVQFFFVFNFVGYNVVYLWIFPIIAGGFTLLLNFSDTVKPLDWLTHFMAGAIIGYAAMLFMVSLGANNWTFMTPVWFWIIWAILGFLGIMQFYQTGGWKIALQGGVILLLFAYVALGPYSAYYQQALDQVKAPVEVAFRAVEKAFTDVWLLATDPTEFYARQQVVNVKPESPIDFAKGLEVSLFDVLPAAVPAGQEFAVTFVMRNEGRLSTPITDISIGFACKQYCNIPPAPDISQPKYSLCQKATAYGLLTSGQVHQFYCADSCTTDSEKVQVNITGDSCVQLCQAADRGDGSVFNNKWSNMIVGATTKCLTPDAQKLSKNYAYIPSLEKDESAAISVRGFTATSSDRRLGETRLAKVALNITYRYATSSSLLTEVISETEMQRKIQNKEQVFRNVPSTTKSTPGRLSLNVGPQPLMAGREALLLVSMSSTRDDGEVRLARDSVINITLPKSIGYGLSCGGRERKTIDNEKEVLEYFVPTDVTILSSDFQSIYAFICSFTVVSDVIEIKSDLITAEMPEYKFALRKEKDLTVTPPIGIIYEPTEKECQAYTGKNPQACFDTKAQKACWYEHTDLATEATRTVTPFVDSNCHSCGIARNCSYFLKDDCKNPVDNAAEYPTSGADRCGYSCVWDPNIGQSGEIRENPLMSGSSLSLKGLCVQKVISGPSPGVCSVVPSQHVSNYNKYKDLIATQIKANGLDQYMNNAEATALVAAVITKESGWNERAPGDGGKSFGLMQINTVAHAECDLDKIRNYDVEENIRCGVAFLSRLAKSHFNEQKVYNCTGGIQGKQVTYTGSSGVLRWYNGWPNDCSGTPNYVEEVWGSTGSNPGYMTNWLGCFQSPQAQAACTPIQQQPYHTTPEYQSIYGSTQTQIEQQLVNVNFQGHSVKFHQAAAHALACVDSEITQLNTGYNFWRETSGGTYDYRTNTNDPSSLSLHSFGIAIDINPSTNPNRQDGTCQTDIPAAVVDVFKKYGFVWGCDFTSNIKDAMHFEWRGL